MDVEKLIEQLNDWNEKYISNLCGDRTIKCEEYCIKDDCLIVKAATALSTLQVENEKLRNEVERQRRSADDRKHLYENAERAYMKVLAELERVTAERDGTVADMTALMAGQCCDLCSVEYCNDRGKTEMCTAFKWSGIKKEDGK